MIIYLIIQLVLISCFDRLNCCLLFASIDCTYVLDGLCLCGTVWVQTETKSSLKTTHVKL